MIFFSAWSGKLAQKQVRPMPVQHSIRDTEWDCDVEVFDYQLVGLMTEFIRHSFLLHLCKRLCFLDHNEIMTQKYES